MNYAKLIDQLFSVNLFNGIKLGLTNSLQLDASLGYPSKAFSSIHVAGTNGKGSVTKKIAAALQSAGYRVGCYTSPHIACFRERICINTEMISEREVEKLLPEVFSSASTSTFFEITTLLAFLYFARQKVDWAVVETGLGGRLDATNILHPKLSIITSISMDHADRLGNTLEEIALEKAGIIKPGIPVLLGPRMPHAIFQEYARFCNSPCAIVKTTFPTYEQENCAIAECALKQLNIPFQAIQEGLKAHLPCRMEHLAAQRVILDVAHNPDGLIELFKAIRQQFTKEKLSIVCGLSKTKDIQQCLQIIQQHAAHIHLVEATNGRAAPIEQLRNALRALQVPDACITMHGSIAEGVHASQKSKDLTVVCGTFFIMAEARAALGIVEPQDVTDMNER